jgi:lipopolysaccharide export system protein LptC
MAKTLIPKAPDALTHNATAPRHDWSARARSTAMDALRYTQFVGVMKRALPVAAFAVISAVVAYFFVARQPARVGLDYQQLGHVQNDLAMVKPRLTGQDAKGNPFVITAAAAIQEAGNPKRVHLTRVEADISQGGAGWINASAATGLADLNVGVLQLNGGISAFTDQGYELHTKSAFVDLNKGVLHGHEPVTGQGPLGTISADEFHFDRASNHLLLQGHVQNVIFGKVK